MENWVVILLIILILVSIPYLDFLHEMFRIPLGVVSTLSGRFGYIWFYIFWFMRPPHVFDTTLDKLEKKVPLKKMTIDEISSTLSNGDLVLGVGRIRPTSVYCGLKWGAGSILTHVGVIVIEQDTPWILEAVSEGIRFIPLQQALMRYNSDITLIRKLEGPRDPDFKKTMDIYFSKHQTDIHKITDSKGVWEMIMAAIDPKLPFSSKEVLVNHRNSDGLFCSELVAQVYMEEGILPDDLGDQYPDSNEYVPADFSASFCSKKQNDEYQTLNSKLNGDYYLDEEIYIDYNQQILWEKEMSLSRF